MAVPARILIVRFQLVAYLDDSEHPSHLDISERPFPHHHRQGIFRTGHILGMLRMFRHPLAHDPVCGMEISAIDAVGKVERGKQIYYFCSDACQQAFLKEGR